MGIAHSQEEPSPGLFAALVSALDEIEGVAESERAAAVRLPEPSASSFSQLSFREIVLNNTILKGNTNHDFIIYPNLPW